MAAAAELLKESPDGHADSMGTCYSAGKKKAPKSSSFSSARSPKAEAKHTPASTQPAPRSSSTGKARRTQISCFDRSHQALGRSASTVKDCRSSLASASAKSASSAHTPCKRAQTSVARSLSFEDHARTPSKDSPQTRELSAAEDCHTDTSSTSNAIHAHRVSQNNNLNDGKKEMHLPHTHSDVSDTSSRSSGFVAGTSKTIPMHTDRHHTLPGISSPRSSHRLTSNTKQDDESAVLLRVPEMGPPPGLHNIRSLSLKSGVGPYEVLTPRKSIEDLQGTTPRNAGSRLVKRSGSFPPLGRKDQGAKGLCKNCKTSNLDSVCFIANDGKIVAANTGPATKCHFHHCNSPKCAANPNYHPESLLPCKKVLPKKQSRSSESVRAKSRINVSHAKEDRLVCTSVGDNDIDLPRCTSEDGHIDAEKNVCHENLILNQGSKESSNEQPSNFMQSVDTQVVRSENGPDNITAPPQSSCDVNEEMGPSSLIAHEGVQRAHAKAYHDDNELSCSDDGTDTPTTPKRSTKGAFDDLSNTEFAQANAVKASQARKSSMEWMRQKYLDTLKEQEAETVRLKKQEMHARKQAGEWMLDCAMGEILHRLAPDGEAGVKVLVEAFETIMQHSDSEAQHEEHVVHDGISLEDASKPLHP